MFDARMTRKSARVARWSRSAAVAVAAATLLAGVPAAVRGQVATPPAAIDSPTPEHGNTKPVSEPKLVFNKPGVVAKVSVKDGDAVKAGQVLAVQDDREERAEIALAESEIEGADLQIEASQADLNLKQVTLRRKKEVYSAGLRPGQTNSEIDEAQAAVDIALVAIKYRRSDLQTAKKKKDKAELLMKQRELISPVDGVVSKVDVKVGEGSDISKPAVTVVSTATLYVEADVPAIKAKRLKLGQAVQVQYEDEEAENGKWMPASVVFLTPYADAASATRRIRLEMKNAAGREAGLRVNLRLPGDGVVAPPAAAADAAARAGAQ